MFRHIGGGECLSTQLMTLGGEQRTRFKPHHQAKLLDGSQTDLQGKVMTTSVSMCRRNYGRMM